MMTTPTTPIQRLRLARELRETRRILRSEANPHLKRLFASWLGILRHDAKILRKIKCQRRIQGQSSQRT